MRDGECGTEGMRDEGMRDRECGTESGTDGEIRGEIRGKSGTGGNPGQTEHSPISRQLAAFWIKALAEI